MDERKQKVLRAIITDYIHTAEPVGSRTIAKKYDLGVSPATIRNEMSDLEELGLIEQPHTSAGRVPSQKGYRYYVDFLIGEENLPAVERDALALFFGERLSQLNRLFEDTCRVLADMSHYLSMVMMSSRSKGSLEQMQLLRVNPFQAVLVLITDTGIVHHRNIDFPVPVSEERLQDISKILMGKLKGLNVEEVNKTLLQEIYSELQPDIGIVDAIFEMMGDAIEDSGEEKVVTEGMVNLLQHPEFQDIDRVREILTFLKDENILKELLVGKNIEGMDFAIGEELSPGKINQCSMVTCTYSINGNTMGRIGILGPTRMEYSRSASLVREAAGHMAQILHNIK